ncbi:nucleolar protein 14 isoform X2 [Tachyglossus aculeatus]|uniref:nucleolar protein 14 isoform X2 n=1 Tax=Tachyglossus aculeatus TaxID=9261 RepID=UPI0018F7BDFC|nr:nucleolar protein 14 isoform X2 [Tachyglossus aculeatus]
MGKARAGRAKGKAPGGQTGSWANTMANTMANPRGKTMAKTMANPFEVKVNRQKFHILGRKTRHDVGLPGVSRAKAIRKRTQTLLKEYRERDKSNVFSDKRFGEYDARINPEEKMMKRFALERQRNHGKKSIYNLNEDEELTHYGQSLADIEKLNDVVDSDSDSEERGLLSAELTAAHFGGGGGLLRKKAPRQQDDDGEEEKPKSRKELIEELIVKSKQEKERQARREDALELTEKLDGDWKEIQSLLSRKAPKADKKEKDDEKPKPDAYDVMVRELGFEMKAQPSDRMKTEEELARQEQERLKKLEADRLRRMLGRDEEEKLQKPKHTSADDLSDGFILDKDDRRMLSYKDGKMNHEEADDSESEGDGDEREMGAVEEEREGGGRDGESEAPDSHSDLESDVDSERDASGNDDQSRGKSQAAEEEPGDEEDQRAKVEAARAELPYTFTAPGSLEELKSLLSGRSPEQQLVVVERIQKCNHPSLAVGNKTKLEKLFGFLLEYVGELATGDPPDLQTVDKLVLQLYSLCQMFPESASNTVKFALREAAHEAEEMVEVKGRAAFPGLDVLIYLKITAILFPTSDFWHPVVTPALMYMSQLLTKCPVLSLQDVVKGLFVCSVFLEYVSLSQRFIPELLNFLLGILHTATPDQSPRGYTLVPPFKPLGENLRLLLVSDKEDMDTWQKKRLPLSLMNGLKETNRTVKNHIRLSCVALCLDLVKRCGTMYASLASVHEIMKPIRALLSGHESGDGYPEELQELIRSVLKDLENQEKCYRPLECEKSKPVPLKLFTPKIVKVLEFGRKQGHSKEEQERKRLIHKHKREFKGAVREIRKDNQFLARMQLSEILERDSERKRKVKQLFNSLATQEGEWKALKRKKLRK